MEHVVPNEMGEREKPLGDYKKRVSDHSFSASHYKLIRFEYEAVCVRAIQAVRLSGLVFNYRSC